MLQQLRTLKGHHIQEFTQCHNNWWPFKFGTEGSTASARAIQ